MSHEPKPDFAKRGAGLTGRRRALMARVLLETESQPDSIVAARHKGVSSRTIKRWRARVATGELPEVSAELAKLRAKTEDVVQLRAEQVLQRVYEFLERATQNDPKDPRMVEAMVKAGEFLTGVCAMASMMNVPRTRATTQDRTPDRAVPAVAGGARDREQPAGGSGPVTIQ